MVKAIIIKGMADLKVTFAACENPTLARIITEVRSSSLSSMNSRIKNPSRVSSNGKTAKCVRRAFPAFSLAIFL